MAGFYPPDTFAEWNHALEWSPVPYTIDDPMLQMYSVPNCSITQQGDIIIHRFLIQFLQNITHCILSVPLIVHFKLDQSIEE